MIDGVTEDLNVPKKAPVCDTMSPKFTATKFLEGRFSTKNRALAKGALFNLLSMDIINGINNCQIRIKYSNKLKPAET